MQTFSAPTRTAKRINDMEKKMTKEQLQRRLDKAVLHIDRTKSFKSCYFADRGIRISVEEDAALIGRSSYTMVFDRIVSGGFSRIYMILSSVVDMANKYDCDVMNADGDHYTSFYKLRDTLSKTEEAKGEYNVFVIFSAWFDVLQSTLFLAPEKPDEMFALNSIYVLNTIVHGTVAKPYEKDMTCKELWNEIRKDFDDYVSGISDDYLVLKYKTKEEQEKEIAEAISGLDIDNAALEGGSDAGED